MAAQNTAPVIIKRKKVVGGDGHHGGAWKVAYADFVTAMMAFFMLMWLLNATTEKQRKGLADYFSPTISVNRVSGGGDGMMGGDSPFSEDAMAFSGIGASSKSASDGDAAKGMTPSEKEAEEETAKFESMRKDLVGKAGEAMHSDQIGRHIITKVTDEGLVVEIFATADRPLFDRENEPEALLVNLLEVVAESFNFLPNKIAVEAHSRTHPIVLSKNPVWDLSIDWAQSLRMGLEKNGIEPERISRVTGHANREPATTNVMEVRNDRVEIILLRSKGGK